MNVYLRNIIIAIIANIVVFLIGWGCIVPDVINDQTHLFGLIGDVEILRGNHCHFVTTDTNKDTLLDILSLLDIQRTCHDEIATVFVRNDRKGNTIIDSSLLSCHGIQQIELTIRYLCTFKCYRH